MTIFNYTEAQISPDFVTGLGIAPGSTWNGTAGTGFAVTPAPTDPTRTTAKPALRLLVPPNQYYTDKLLVGVFAGANNGGSLSTDLGLAYVVAHYEGNEAMIPRPSWQTFDDANGNPVSYYGWWIWLRHDGRHGHANLYFEAVPLDVAKQNRVIGPLQYSPQAALYDYDIAVAPSDPVVAGVSYQTAAAAINYLRGVGANNPRITLMETATYEDWSTGTANYTPKGYLTVEAADGEIATIGHTGYSSANTLRTKWNGIRFPV